MSCRTRRLFCKIIFISTSFCFSQSSYADIHDVSRIFHSTSTLEAFEICHSGGCAEVSAVSLSDEEWQPVRAVFAKDAKNAAEERAHLATAIGVLEKLVGEKIGTSGDLAGTFDNSHYKGQLDCNDEAINSTTYMRLLASNGLMQLHAIEDMRTLSFFFTGWPHGTAVIHEIATGERYAVDSWFYGNGNAKAVVPFAQWKSGYNPADNPIGKPRATLLSNLEASKPQKQVFADLISVYR